MAENSNPEDFEQDIDEKDPFDDAPDDFNDSFSEEEQGTEVEDDDLEELDLDEAKEVLRITPKTKNPFNVVRLKEINFIPSTDSNKYPRIEIHLKEKTASGVAEATIVEFNPFTNKVENKNGKKVDRRLQAIAKLKHFFGAFTDKPVEGMGKLTVDKSDLEGSFKKLYDMFMALLPKDYQKIDANAKLTYYKNNLQLPQFPPFISSVHKPRLDEMKWNPSYDKDIPEGGVVAKGNSENEDDDDDDF